MVELSVSMRSNEVPVLKVKRLIMSFKKKQKVIKSNKKSRELFNGSCLLKSVVGYILTNQLNKKTANDLVD